MKKILIGLFGIISLGLINFSSAFDCNSSYSVNLDSDSIFVPVYITSSINASRGMFTDGNKTYFLSFFDGIATFLMDNNVPVIGPVVFSGGSTVSYSLVDINSQFDTCQIEIVSLSSNSVGGSCDYSDYILISDVTKNYCTNRYSDLIPEDDITSGYCETEFGLIDPENCPASVGTGDVNWSTFWVNNTQIQGASSIYLYLPDFLSWDYTYINTGSTLQIDVENEGDSEYIQNILDIQSYHPDKDQFAISFAGFLTLLMPYIIITLFIIFVWKLIRRIFR